MRGVSVCSESIADRLMSVAESCVSALCFEGHAHLSSGNIMYSTCSLPPYTEAS